MSFDTGSPLPGPFGDSHLRGMDDERMTAPVLDMTAAAAHLGITPNTLRAYRFKRYPPSHERCPFPEPAMRVAGGRVPLWTAEQLDAWKALRER